MVELQLRRRGIRDTATLRLMGQVPREEFVPRELLACAYDDRALDVGLGQTISQPYIVAYMTEQLELQPDHRVLEIGTGTGYQTAMLAGIANAVWSIEFLQELSHAAQARLHRLGYSGIRFRIGDGTAGWPDAAPFDRIIVTAGAPTIPEPLLDQLKIHGKMVLPIGGRCEQRLVVVEKLEKRFVEHTLIGCRFVKLVGRHGWNADES